MRMEKIVTSLLVVLAMFGRAYAEQQLTVAAAADLQFAMQEIATRYQKQTGTHVKLSFGSSGNFFAQIQNGAPFDLFFSADRQYPEKLQQSGYAEPATLRNYAVGKLVLWVPANSKLDLSRGLKVLADPAVSKISIANPEHAPYGRAAVAALQHEGIYDAVSKKFVLGENISQAAAFAFSGNADAGLLALSLAVAPSMKDKGQYVEVPAGDYQPLTQAAVVVKSSRAKSAARQFLDFVSSPPIVELLRQYGFAAPSAPPNSK
jgi:molybdate transport system substrate-binding protein